MADENQLIKTQQKPSSPFLNGVLVGAVLGVAAFFLLGTKEGKQSRKKLVIKSKKILAHIANILDELEEKSQDLGKELTIKGKAIKEELEEKTSNFGEIIGKQKKIAERKINKIEKQVTPVVGKTTEILRNAGKKFFFRKGKRLKKKS